MGLVTSEPSQSSSAAPSTGKPPTKREELVQKAHTEFGWPKEELASKSDRQLVRIVHKEERYEQPSNVPASAVASAAAPETPVREQPVAQASADSVEAPKVERPVEPSIEAKRAYLVSDLGYSEKVVREMPDREVEPIYANDLRYRDSKAPQAEAIAASDSDSRGLGTVGIIALVLLILLVAAGAIWWLTRPLVEQPNVTPAPTIARTTAPTTAPTATTVATVKQNFVITDSSGKPVEGVTVWGVSGQDRTPNVTTNSRGEATLDLKPGQSYRISAQKDGYDLFSSKDLVTSGSAPVAISIQLAPTGTASERDRPGTDVSGFVAPNADTQAAAIQGALFYGSRSGGIDSASQVKSIILTTIPTTNWRTAFQDGNLIGFRNGSDIGDAAWRIETTDGRVFYIQVKCSNLVIPPTVTRTPTPTPAPTRTPTPTSPPCCVVVPTPTPVPTPAPTPSKDPTKSVPTFPPPSPGATITPPPTATPLPISYNVVIVESHASTCGTQSCWLVRWRASNVTPTSANGWVAWGAQGYITANSEPGTPDGAGNWVTTLYPLNPGHTYQFQAYTAVPGGQAVGSGVNTFAAP